MKIKNVSESPLGAHHRLHPLVGDPPEGPERTIFPGSALEVAAKTPPSVWLYDKNGQRFWRGTLRPNDVIVADPDARRVRWSPDTVSETDLAEARAMFGDDVFAGISLDDIRQRMAELDPAAPAFSFTTPATSVEALEVDDCTLKSIGVAVDVVLLMLGAWAIKEKMPADVWKKMVNAVYNALFDWDPSITQALLGGTSALASQQATGATTASKAFNIISTLTKDGVIVIIKEIFKNLSALDAAILALTVSVQITATFVTEGTWPVVFMSIQLAIGGVVLIKDATEAWQTCNPGKPLPPPAPSQPSDTFIYSYSHNNNHLVAMGDSPMTLQCLEPVTWSPVERGYWVIEYSGESAPSGDPDPNHPPSIPYSIVRLRPLSAPDHVLVRLSGDPGTPITLIPESQVPSDNPAAAQWIATRASPAKNDNGSDPNKAIARGAYLLCSPELMTAMHVEGSKVVMREYDTETAPSDDAFWFQDAKMSGYLLGDEITVRWRLELFDNQNGWSFYNAANPGLGVNLPMQSGTLTRPDDVAYWSVVAIGKSKSTGEGFAELRVWRDAGGLMVQAAFNAIGRHGWKRWGPADRETSVVQHPEMGVQFSVSILEEDTGGSASSDQT